MGILLALLSLAVVPAQAAPVVLDRLEASVNSALILKSDIAKFRQTVGLRTQLDPLFAGTAIGAKGASATDQEIIQFLIDERLIAQQFQIPDSEVEQEINSIQANNKIERSALKSALREQGYSFDDYFELIRTSIAKRNLIDRDIRTKVNVSDDDVKNYFYNNYSKKSSVPLAYRARMITVSPENYKSAGAAKETAERALQEIRSGEPFEEVARRVSDDANKESGGDLGTLTDDQMSPLIRDQLKKLQIGEVSAVFGSPTTRYFILKLVDVKSAEDQRLNKMREEIRNQLASAEYAHQISLWLERQRQNAFIHRAGAETAALNR